MCNRTAGIRTELILYIPHFDTLMLGGLRVFSIVHKPKPRRRVLYDDEGATKVYEDRVWGVSTTIYVQVTHVLNDFSTLFVAESLLRDTAAWCGIYS